MVLITAWRLPQKFFIIIIISSSGSSSIIIITIIIIIIINIVNIIIIIIIAAAAVADSTAIARIARDFFVNRTGFLRESHVSAREHNQWY